MPETKRSCNRNGERSAAIEDRSHEKFVVEVRNSKTELNVPNESQGIESASQHQDAGTEVEQAIPGRVDTECAAGVWTTNIAGLPSNGRNAENWIRRSLDAWPGDELRTKDTNGSLYRGGSYVEGHAFRAVVPVRGW